MTIREFAAAQEGPHSLCYTAVVDEAERQIAEVNEALRLANAKYDRIGDLLDKLSPDWEGEYVDVIREFHRQLVASVLSAEAMRRALEMAYEAMNHLGDVLNDHDMCTEEDEEKTTPAFDSVRIALDAPPSAHLDRIRREAAAEAYAWEQWPDDNGTGHYPPDETDVLTEIVSATGREYKVQRISKRRGTYGDSFTKRWRHIEPAELRAARSQWLTPLN